MNKSSGVTIGFTGLLTIVFIVLKLTEVIDWSWWWVISPILISVGLSIIFLGLILLALIALELTE